MTVSENSGDIIFTESFGAYKRYVGFEIHLCRGFDPESKGKIESVVKYVKGNYLACRIYHGISELNTGGIAWLDRTANAKVHESTKLVPDKVFASERKHLCPAPSIKRPPEAKSAVVRKTNVIHFKQNRYEVPKGTYFPGRIARIDVDYAAGTLTLSDEKSAEILARHSLAEGVGRLVKLTGEYGRSSTQRFEKTKSELLECVGDIEGADIYIDSLIKAYPRYARDQLKLMLKCARSHSEKDMAAAFTYCIRRELISANDFRDSLAYLASLSAPVKKQTVLIPEKYHSTKPKVRDLAKYEMVA